MIEEDDLLPLLVDSVYCASLGFTTETILALFIPNTYEVYWNISAEKLMQRMQREYKIFWNDVRLAKAKEIGMTPVEVAILASIVEEETAAVDEYPIVAGLYINRLQRGIPLQADPTVKFAVGDFSLQLDRSSAASDVYKRQNASCSNIWRSILPTIPTNMPDFLPDHSVSRLLGDWMPC